MPRYFLHIRNQVGFVRDEEGRELANIDEARDAAIEGIRSLLREELLTGLIDLRGAIEVGTADGRSVLEVPYRDALEVRTEAS